MDRRAFMETMAAGGLSLCYPSAELVAEAEAAGISLEQESSMSVASSCSCMLGCPCLLRSRLHGIKTMADRRKVAREHFKVYGDYAEDLYETYRHLIEQTPLPRTLIRRLL